MPKSPIPTLNLGSTNADARAEDRPPLTTGTLSPASPTSPRSAPGSPYQKATTNTPAMGQKKFGSENYFTSASQGPAEIENSEVPQSPMITAIPQYPPSPKGSQKHGRDPSKSFFANLKASKSSHRLQSLEGPVTESSEASTKGRAGSKDRNIYSSSRGRESTPDLPGSGARNDRANSASARDKTNRDPTNGVASVAEPISDSDPSQFSSKKSKPKFTHLLTRSRSIKIDETVFKPKPSTPLRLPTNGDSKHDREVNQEFQEPLKTAPLEQERDRSFKDVMGSGIRNRSADRQAPSGQDEHHLAVKKDKGYGGAITLSSSFKEGAGAQLLSNIKQSSSRAADGLGKAGKGFFGKITRNGSSHERELVTDDTYVCSVINLPLVEQTRRTRISKRMSESKDKTEFWMPALPWRCIDYLNYKGCEEEGLYRIPGSGKDVKHWQRRFDTEYDINLFDEPELYDINTIGSMFKAWLRGLPDEIFPSKTQSLIAEKCMGATTAPRLLKDELSKLPPFNYYLLFAITCHLSLLFQYRDKNKMDYRNLCICFQPCLKIDGFCFQFLVCDWRNCWQGCRDEKQYEEEEYRVEREKDLPPQTSAGESTNNSTETPPDDRAISSSDSSQPSAAEKSSDQTKSESNRAKSPIRGRQTGPNAPNALGNTPLRSTSQLPELRPPLSPIEI